MKATVNVKINGVKHTALSLDIATLVELILIRHDIFMPKPYELIVELDSGQKQTQIINEVVE